ncbi:MAG: C45 family peptidase [Oscillospiraceae bacterium]|nr:C45 family peptidase [Oscillospiraceae bacterium]
MGFKTQFFTKSVSLALSALIGFFSSTTGLWSEQLKSLESITKVADNYYLMDYTYDYDLDTLLESKTGNSTTVGLLLYALADVFLQLNPEAKEIVANLGLYVDLDANAVSETIQKLTGSTESFGCTTFNATTPSGDALLGRNYDYMDSPGLTVWTDPKDGYASVSTVSLYLLGYGGDILPESFVTSLLTLVAPYCPVDGMNEKGLSIGVLELETPETFQQTEKKDITTSAVIRKVLDHAATVEEAVEIFNEYDMHDLLGGNCTYHYQISDANGDTAIIEYVNGETTVLRPDETGSLVATNFWLSEGVDDPDGIGYDRYDTAKRMLSEKNYRITEKEAMDILDATHLENEDLHGYICSTLWSVVYNNTDRTFDVCAMYDYDNVYSFSVYEPMRFLE